MELMSTNLNSAICEQIAHEKYNANLYLYICGFLRNKGLDNIAKMFEKQHLEEIEHSLDFFNLLTDLNAPVVIPEIDKVNISITSIMDIAQHYLDREILTTTSINEIKKIAIAEDNPVVEEKMREMISKQQAEYAESTSFMDKCMMLPEWWQVAIWDISL